MVFYRSFHPELLQLCSLLVVIQEQTRIPIMINSLYYPKKHVMSSCNLHIKFTKRDIYYLLFVHDTLRIFHSLSARRTISETNSIKCNKACLKIRSNKWIASCAIYQRPLFSQYFSWLFFATERPIPWTFDTAIGIVGSWVSASFSNLLLKKEINFFSSHLKSTPGPLASYVAE